VSAAPPPHLLVIGYGNTLRRDDGVGPRVAAAVGAMNLPGVQALAQHQLVPELAEPVANAAAVIFVDADVNAQGEIALREVMARGEGEVFAHAADPSSLLALAGQLFGRQPPAWTLSIPVADLGFGEGVSPRAEAGFQVALELIRAHARQFGHSRD